jgi:hypothetical protein
LHTGTSERGSIQPRSLLAAGLRLASSKAVDSVVTHKKRRARPEQTRIKRENNAAGRGRLPSFKQRPTENPQGERRSSGR